MGEQLQRSGVRQRRYILVLICLFFSFKLTAQEIEIIKSPALFEMIEQCDQEAGLKVYNMWATWCAPCVKEMPLFESANEHFSNVDVILVSIDDVDLLESRVKPFVKKRGINSKVVLLNETDFNEIIPKISEQWSGAIPATLMVDCRNGQRHFFEKEFKEGELKSKIQDILNN